MAFDQSAVIRAMDFSLSEEQQLLKDSVTRYLENDYDFRDRQATVQTERGFSDQHWSQFAELGWLSVPLPESCGGFGGRIEDTAVLCEAFGRELVVEPFLATVMLGGKLLAAHGDDFLFARLDFGGKRPSVQGKRLVRFVKLGLHLFHQAFGGQTRAAFGGHPFGEIHAAALPPRRAPVMSW